MILLKYSENTGCSSGEIAWGNGIDLVLIVNYTVSCSQFSFLTFGHEFGQSQIGWVELVEAQRQKLALGIRLPFDGLRAT